MSDRKITALTELTAPVAADLFPVIDISEAANANFSNIAVCFFK